MKEYKIGDKTLKLATPVPKRVRGFLVCLGLSTLSELTDKAKADSVGAFLLDFQLDEKKIKAVMDVCLQENTVTEWDDIPTEIINEIFSDFFVSVLQSYRKAQNSLNAFA